MLKAKLLGATAAAESLAIEDVFSTYLYTGNGSTQTITNDIDLAGEGGLVWIKSRSAATDNFLFDTLRGTNNEINSNTTQAAATLANSVTAFNADGFSLGSAAGINVSAATYASWTFRKAERFFDVVTYTGNNVQGRSISHNLGTEPGVILVKITSGTSDNWVVYHRSIGAGKFLKLNATDAQLSSVAVFPTIPTDSVFYVGNDSAVNWSGGTYVAYLFAHDPLGPSGDGSDGLISCGSYTGNGSTTGPVIDLGWEPQWLLVKRSNSTSDWSIIDTMRGFTAAGADDERLIANTIDSTQSLGSALALTPTGFSLTSTIAELNASGGTYIYIAIRRGPMREPTSGTEVFQPVAYTGTGAARDMTASLGGSPDLVYIRNRSGSDNPFYTKLSGIGKYLWTNSTAAEASYTNEVTGWLNNGYRLTTNNVNSVNSLGANYVTHMFRRAPGFFDVVAYTGDGTLNPIGHNLTVNPELIIFKRRASVQDWWVIHYATDKSLRLNTTAAGTTADASIYGPVTPTTFVPYLNTSGLTHISYLFASLPGISKVGSYTGNGSSQTINCGFTTGARFVLIKRTDSTGDWYVWDTARGIVTGNDPHLSLNTTAAEVTTNDTIDPASSGFIVNQVAATNVNVSSASYIFMAIS
jgi:hypothetical protein